MKWANFKYLGLLLITFPRIALAFPPYRSTDADTADPWIIECRLGVVEWVRESDADEFSTPLVRTNLGLPQHLEFLTEFEYDPEKERLSDAAIGMKWIPWQRQINLGTECLVLIPTHVEGRYGIELTGLATWHKEPFLVHLNAGGFQDHRPTSLEEGWKTGLIGEWQLKGWRPGLEVIAKGVHGEPVQLEMGLGVIIEIGWADIRIGLHKGLTDAAADFSTNLWVTWKLPLPIE